MGRTGDREGQSSSSSGPGCGDKERRSGFSVASINDLLMIGELETIVATGRLGRGLSVGLFLGVAGVCRSLGMDEGALGVTRVGDCGYQYLAQTQLE